MISLGFLSALVCKINLNLHEVEVDVNEVKRNFKGHNTDIIIYRSLFCNTYIAIMLFHITPSKDIYYIFTWNILH